MQHQNLGTARMKGLSEPTICDKIIAHRQFEFHGYFTSKLNQVFGTKKINKLDDIHQARGGR